MTVLYVLLLLIAVGCFAAAAFNVVVKLNLIALGLLFVTLVFLIQEVKRL